MPFFMAQKSPHMVQVSFCLGALFSRVFRAYSRCVVIVSSLCVSWQNKKRVLQEIKSYKTLYHRVLQNQECLVRLLTFGIKFIFYGLPV
jgi:hypothetical protein